MLFSTYSIDHLNPIAKLKFSKHKNKKIRFQNNFFWDLKLFRNLIIES